MDATFLDKAEREIMQLLHEVRPKLLESHGVVEHKMKQDNSVVTELDKSIETKIRNLLRKLDPDIGIEGEEFGIEGSRDQYWLVDPIDGTEQFIRGMLGCKNLMTLVENGEAVWALMYMFVTDELWLARKGKGVTCNGKIIQRPYRPLNRNWIEINTNFMKPANVDTLVRIRHRIGGFTMYRDTPTVVAGKIDGVIAIDAGGGPWDYAPRGLFYRESGAKIANIGSKEYDFAINNFVVAHPDNFDELMRLVTDNE